MIIRVGLENGFERRRSIAWALDFPGCFISGEDASTAIISIPRALLDYEAWIRRHTAQSWVRLADFDIRLVETWEVYFVNPGYQVAQDGVEINAWFRDDWRPLSNIEIERGLELLSYSRADLLAQSCPLSQEQVDRQYPFPDL